jgi:hypothetical protein
VSSRDADATDSPDTELGRATVIIDELLVTIVVSRAPRLSYMTTAAFVKLRKLKLAQVDMSRAGKRIADLCRLRKLEIRKTEDERFGMVNSYPVVILEEFFRAFLEGQ